MLFGRSVSKETEGQRPINALTQLNEQDGGLESGFGEAITVASGNAFDEAMEAELAKIVSELIDGVVWSFDLILVEQSTV
jgi:hypothetical protein